MRRSPFGEWVNVFYDPSQTNEATLLQLIKNRQCPGAQHITDSQGYALNPVIGPGDPVQLRIESAQPVEMTAESQLPQGWQLAGQASGGEGIQIVTLATPGNTAQGDEDIALHFSDGSSCLLYTSPSPRDRG